jgi:hypothetical protein
MNAVAEAVSLAEPKVAGIAAALARWYADHASIRRAWAIEDVLALKILVTLEPTFDGDDTLPVWLANNRDWANDLRLRMQREVQLQLVVSDGFGESSVNAHAVAIAEVSWRDSWVTSP